jgi:predicted NBD/HSP70 family sugar kinase
MQEARRLGLGADHPADLQRLCAEGDVRALNIKDRVFTYLSAALVNAVNHYDPALIVLGGQLVRSWPELTAELAERVKGRSFGYLSKDVRIVESMLGEDATPLGAVAIAIHHILRDPRAVLSVIPARDMVSGVIAPAAP